MTQDEIIRMAREAGLFNQTSPYHIDQIQTVERFAALVAAHERERVMNEPLTKAMWDRFESEIRANEREACAKVCEEISINNYGHCDGTVPAACAAAIQARSENGTA